MDKILAQLNKAEIDVRDFENKRDTAVERFLDNLPPDVQDGLRDNGDSGDSDAVISLSDGKALILCGLNYDEDAPPEESGWYWDRLSVAPVFE